MNLRVALSCHQLLVKLLCLTLRGEQGLGFEESILEPAVEQLGIAVLTG